MSNEFKAGRYICEYCGCDKVATTKMDVKLHTVMLCDEHADIIHDSAGYCGVNCMLGYGCTQEC